MSSEGNATQKEYEIVDLTTSPEEEPVENHRTWQNCEAVIDLSFDDSSPGDDYTRDMMQSLKGSRRKRQRKSAKVDPVKNSHIEVIDVEALPAAACPNDSVPEEASPLSTEQNKESSYKQKLGPIRMEFVSEFIPKHTFADTLQNPTLKTTPLYRELLEYQLSLPNHPSSSVFVRALESRLDLLRFAITGPEGTPYENGVFLFDCYLQDYPQRAPRVQFLTTGGGKVRFNPNLYNCGKVCLSLLGTWQGPGWVANQSTLLQVLTSIQGLVLVPDPYFNEPGFNSKQPNAAARSEEYNRKIRSYTLLYAMRDMLKLVKKPGLYPEWVPVLLLHFQCRAKRIEQQLQEWVADNNSLRKTTEEIRTLLGSVV